MCFKQAITKPIKPLCQILLISLFMSMPKKNYWKNGTSNAFKIPRKCINDPNSYFKHYASLSKEEAIATASKIWDEINGLNLNQNILPTRERANLILKKGKNHQVELVKLRK